MKKLMIVPASMMIAAGCALFASEFGELKETWTEDVDLAAAKVYVSTNATVPEVEAAKLLMRAQRMVAGLTDTTNVTPQIAAEWPKDGVVIGWQESALLAPFAKDLGLTPWRETKNHGDIVVEAQRGGVYVLAGNAPEWAYFAVADVLYRNGARFIHTGAPEDGWESGTYLEWMKAIRAPRSRRYVPYVARRTGFALPKGGKDDAEKIAMNQFAARNCASPAGPLGGGRGRGSIGCESIQPPVNDFKKHPEWFPLVDGKRWRPAPGGWVTEGCWTCPGFADWVVEHETKAYHHFGGEKMITDLCLTNSDGGPKCQCDNCKAYRAQFPDDSSWYWDYHAKIAKRINANVPGLYNYTFAYINSLCFPKAGKKVVSHLDAIQYCPYQRCYCHPYSDRTCRTNRTDMDRAEEWRKAEIPIGDFDYCYDVFYPSMNMPNWNITWDVVRYWKELNEGRGIPSIYMECATSPKGCGGKSRISAYAVVRALWDCAEAPAETHLEDFCRVGFGDGAPEMLAWYRACAKAWQAQRAHLTSTFNNPTGTAKSYFSEDLVASGAKAFASAKAKIRARLAKTDGPMEKLTREQNLAKKQLATLQWERKWAYDAWKELREKAMKTSVTVNCELGDESDLEFDRMPELKFVQQWPQWEKEERTKTSARVYRTKDALRLRVASRSEANEPVPPAKSVAGDNPRAYCDEHLELFFQAPGKSDYYHLCVGADGSRYDALCKDQKAFTSDAWTSEVKTRKGLCEYTLTIPWSIFGADFKPAAGDVFKLSVVLRTKVPDPKHPGGTKPFSSGLPSVSFHDPAVGADIVIDDNAGRRAGGAN